MVLSAVIVGFMAGFFGIGGGLIMVPILFYIFSFVGMEQAFVMHMAIGTSFLIIIPNSIISTLTHMKFKAVEFSIVRTFGVFVMIGVVLGTVFAVSLKTSGLVLEALRSLCANRISRSALLQIYTCLPYLLYYTRTQGTKYIR